MRPRTRAHPDQSSQPLLYDQKNKLALPPLILKQQISKSIRTRSQTREHNSPATSCHISTVQSSSPEEPTRKLCEQSLFPYSKSEQETKAEQECSEKQSQSGEKESWSGILGEYREEIMAYVVEREQEYKIDGEYLHHSNLITKKMRLNLVRHMFKIYHRFDLLRTTLHLAVHYLDLYFAKERILKDSIQSIVVVQACLFIAMKYEEIYPPELKDWVSRSYRQDVIKMQAKILACLGFQLAHYTVEHHIQLNIWENGEVSDEQQEVMELMSDLSLFDINIRAKPGSQVALAISALAQHKTPPNHRMSLAVKWMAERNGDSLAWLRQHKYGSAGHNSIF